MKIIKIFIIGVLLSSALFAQFDLGLRVGANYPYVGMEDYRVYEEMFSYRANIKGYMAGAFVGASSGNFGLHLEANVPLENFNFHGIIDGDPFLEVISDAKLNYQYLNAVLMARYQLNILLFKPYLGVGINVGIPILDLIDENATIDMRDFDVNQLAYAVSAGIVVLDFLDVEVRYTSGITDLVNGELLTDDPNFGETVRLSFGLHIY